MAQRLNLTTAPAQEPVSVDSLKEHLRVTFDDDDRYIFNLIRQARRSVEIQINRALITQTLEITRDNFPAGRVILLERSPVQSVSDIKYQDNTDTEQTLSSDEYQVDTKSKPGRVILKDGYSWPTTSNNANNVTITYDAGYGDDPEDVPADLQLGIMQLAAHWYEVRHPVDVRPGAGAILIPKTVDYLIQPYKVYMP